MAAVNPDPPPTEPPLTQTTGVDLHFSVHPRLLMNTNSQLGEDGGTTHTHTGGHRCCRCKRTKWQPEKRKSVPCVKETLGDVLDYAVLDE